VKILNWSILLFALFCLASCEKTVFNRGYVIEQGDFNKIIVGKDDMNAVFEKIGSPTIRSSVEANDGSFSWYYVSKRTEKSGFLDPKVTDQKTMIVTFDKNGIVRLVKEGQIEKPVTPVKDTTKAEGKDAGIIGETFGGLGKYMKRYTEKDK
jgi:outer membrane protein assembly factor BamE (lipoprotein component of BamABCDE complex)